MPRTTLLLVGFILAAMPLAKARAAEPAPLELHDGDRVVLLGGTFIERMQAHGFVEALLTARYVDRDITFRNLGWSGDTVEGISRAVFGSPADGFQRLKKDVAEAEPSVVLVNYGANEAYAGPAGLDAFGQQLNVLLDFLESTGARVALLTPHAYWRLGPPFPDPSAYNESVAEYSDLLRETAARRGLAFVDLQDLAAKLPADASSELPLTENGVHLTGYGYWRAAPLIAARLGAAAPAGWRMNIDAGDLSYDAVGVSVAGVENDGAALEITAAARRLGFYEPPEQFRLPPNSAASAGVLTIRGLPAGAYHVRIDGEQVCTADARQFERGLALFVDPDARQAEELRRTIVGKNELYFHRHRPQNETYLFLFRKHEQGNNAVEVPQFEPLVEEKDQQIARLKRPAAHVYEVVRDSSRQ